MLFSRRDASKREFWPRKVKLKFRPQLISGHVTLRSTGHRRSICISIDACWPCEHNGIIRITLSHSFKKLQNACDLIRPEITLTEGHWLKLHPNHQHYLDVWLSWLIRMIINETVAMPTQNVLRITFMVWHGLGKEVTGHRSLWSESRNFQGTCKTVQK